MLLFGILVLYQILAGRAPIPKPHSCTCRRVRTFCLRDVLVHALRRFAQTMRLPHLIELLSKEKGFIGTLIWLPRTTATQLSTKALLLAMAK